MLKGTFDLPTQFSNKALWKIIEIYESQLRSIYIKQEEYYIGRNTGILSRRTVDNADPSAPDWRIPVPYGRKIVKTISGYMYKPGNITYKYESGEDRINEIYKDNNEPTKTDNIRTYASVNGHSYELHYIEAGQTLKPRFTLIKASDGFMIYNYEIEPKPIAFVRLYKQGKDRYYEVYYNNDIILYRFDESKTKLVEESRVINVYNMIPVVEHKNNEEIESDITPIERLIDAYDVLISDSMNEFDRFAWAYLVLTGKLEAEDVADIKKKRVFELMDSSDQASFLTKDINHEFIKFMTDRVKREIHIQSFIPDLDDIKISSSASGVSIDKFIYIMEYTAADKEAYTKIAISRRVDILNALDPLSANQIVLEAVNMKRNLPNQDKENAAIYATLDGRGISRESLMTQYMPWIPDPEAELKKYEEEQGIDDTGFDEDEEEG